MLKRISAEELEKIIFERKDGEALDLSGCLLENLDLSGWDLRDINFEIPDGQFLGLIGRAALRRMHFFRVQALRGRS